MYTEVGMFQHKERLYIQYLNLDMDDVFIKDEQKNTVLVFTSGGCILSPEKELGKQIIGDISQRDGKLCFKFSMKENEELGKPNDDIKTEISSNELDAYFKVEVIATKYYLDHKEALV